MTTLSLSQVVGLCLRHSGSASNVAHAATIAWLESGFDTAARCYNHRDREGRVTCGAAGAGVISTDRGLWQFNDKSHAAITDAQADDPGYSTGQAFHYSAGFTSWGEWSSRHYLPGGSQSGTARGQQAARIYDSAQAEAKAQLAGEKGPSPIGAGIGAIGGAIVGGADAAGGAIGGAANAVLSVPEFLGKLSSRATWLRVLQVVAGTAAVGAGALMLGKDLSPLGSAATTLGHAAAGKVGASSVAAAV